MSLIDRFLLRRRAGQPDMEAGREDDAVHPHLSDAENFLPHHEPQDSPDYDEKSQPSKRAGLLSELLRAPKAGQKMRKRMRFGILPLLEVLALCLVLLFGGGAYLLWRIQQAPMSLDWARGYLERLLAADESGDRVAIRNLTVRWQDDRQAIQIVAAPVDSFDRAGAMLARTNKLIIEVRPQQALVGRSPLTRFEADGGVFSVVLRTNGKVDAGLGAPDAVMKRETRPDPARLDKLIKAAQGAIRGEGRAGGLDYVSIENAQIIFFDERSRRTSTAIDALVKARRIGARVTGLMSAELKGASPQRGKVELRFAGSSPGPLTLALKLDHFNPVVFVPPDIAPPLQMIDAPIDASAGLRLDSKGDLVSTSLTMVAAPGKLRRGDDVRPLQSAHLVANYDPRSDTFLLTRLSVVGVGANLEASGALRAPMQVFGGPGRFEASAFKVSVPVFKWTTQPDKYWSSSKSGEVRDLKVSGRIFKGGDRIILDAIDAKLDRSVLRLSGDARRGALGKARSKYSLQARGAVTGVVNVQAILALWPANLAKGAREWLGEVLEGGEIRNATFVADISAASIAEGRIPDSALSLKFAFDGGAVRPYKGSFLIEDAKGSARLGGDSFRLTANGRSGTVRLENASVDIARLTDKETPAVVKVLARGDVAGFARMFAHDLDANASARLGGAGSFKFSLSRPMRSVVPWKDYVLDGQGAFTGVRIENVVGSLPLEAGKFDVTLDRDHLVAKGGARIGGQPANLTWQEAIVAGKKATTQVNISGVADANILDNFGVPSRSLLRGKFGADISASGERLNMNRGVVNLDLTQTDISPENLKWRKPIGTPGQFVLAFGKAGATSPTAFSINGLANGASVMGSAVLGVDGRMMSGDLKRLYIPGAFDVAATLRQGESGRQLDINGPLIEGRTVLGLIFGGGGQKASSVGPEAPLRINAKVDQVFAGAQPTFKALTWSGELESGSLMRARLQAVGLSGKAFNLAVTPDAQSGNRILRIDMEDLGAAGRFILKEGQVRGGFGNVEGTLSKEEGQEIANLTLRAKDFELLGTPALARLLTLGSLRGLADVLNGDGIKFKTLTAPMTVKDNALRIEEARASGPAIGITVKGNLYFATETMDVNGVLAPSYGINSALGKVPVVGGLFVSRKGEGIIGMTYAMNGPFENAKTSVNPLSVLTPGILRRIFESGTPVAEKTPSDSANN